MALEQRLVEFTHERDFDSLVLKSDQPTIVDFYADWCGPCQKFGPMLEERVKNNPNIRVVKVNVDLNPELAEKYKVTSIPHIVLFKNGKITNSFTGSDTGSLDNMIKNIS